MGKVMEQGEAQAAGISKYTYLEQKLFEICRGSVAAVLAVGFFKGKRSWLPLQNRSLGTVVTPTVLLLLAAPVLFSLNISIHLSCAVHWGKGR